MNRLVNGSDGREWVVRGQMEWRQPATADDFEHDVAASYGPGIAMLVVTLVLAGVVLLWRPDSVLVPPWVPLALLALALFFPLRWVLRRPWSVVAETDGDPTGEYPSERWVGTVRGIFAVHTEVNTVTKSIQKHALPDFDGPLHPVE